MIVRLTSFSLAPDKVEDARRIYQQEIVPEVKKQKGNTGINLLEPTDGSTNYISISHWKSKEDVDAYEKTGKYEELVGKLKSLFSGKPELKTYKVQD